MFGRSSGNHDWLLANASACVSCGFRLRNARNARDCVWMETELYKQSFSADRSRIQSHHARTKPLPVDARQRSATSTEIKLMATLDRTRRLTRHLSWSAITLTTAAGARQQRVVCDDENENESCRKIVSKISARRCEDKVIKAPL